MSYGTRFVIPKCLLGHKSRHVKIVWCRVWKSQNNEGFPWLGRDWHKQRKKRKKIYKSVIGLIALWACVFVWPSRKEKQGI